MVLCHIGTRHKDYRFAYQTKFGDTAGTSTTNHEVGGFISSAHVGDKVGNYKIGDVLSFQSLGYLSTVVLSCLPDKLNIGALHLIEVL